MDLQQTHSINRSLQLGGMALGELRKVNPLQFPRPQQAGFLVLKAPDFPSIIVECAYITNPHEEMLLRKAEFQNRLVRGMAESIKKFLAGFGRPDGRLKSRR